ncbi:hypothetical protein [Agilicoccus flavus]|uniref:hypothetical protein n=1 Tax=Agilicoccus flavus TaxID=2775968 RepID=UPI001CF71959|nr:hypothetical protein [Agilicoccus flavus]
MDDVHGDHDHPVLRVSLTSQGIPGAKGSSECSTMPSSRAPARSASSPCTRVLAGASVLVAVSGGVLRAGRREAGQPRASYVDRQES